jgi:hypothetical protein
VLDGAPAMRAASSTDRQAAGVSTPIAGACSSAASTTLGDGGGGFHLSGGHPPLSSSSFDGEFSGVARGESPYCSRSRYSSLCCSRRSQRRILLSFLRAASTVTLY